MSAKYLLPCRCGQQIVVELREAGETTVCPCGQSLPIPTMLEMTTLERAPSTPAAAPSQATWSWRQGAWLLGIVFLLTAIVIGVIVYRSMRPTPPADLINPEQISEIANRFTAAQTWQTWQAMKQGLDRRTDQRYAAALVVYHGLLVFPGILALLGFALIGLGVAMGKKRGGDKETGRQGERRTS